MRASIIFQLFFLLLVFLVAGCKKDIEGVDTKSKVYLVDFTEYIPESKSFTANDIKGYVDELGLADISPFIKYDIKIYKIKYKTSFQGDTIIASGLLAVPIPEKKSNAFPMLSYQHGTITTNNESPSENPAREITSIATYIASTGFIVVIPDYIGYGSTSDKFHPFMIKEYSINAVLDLIRASKEFVAFENPCKTNGNLFLSGYSEGGSATLAALSAIENDPKNSDLIVTATACGAGIYDLNDFRNWLVAQAKYDQPYLIGYLLESFKNYAGLVIEDSLVYSKKFAPLITDMVDGIRTSEQMNDLFSTLDVGELFNDNFENPDTTFKYDKNYTGLRTAFTENSISAWNLINSDVTLYYGKSDMWVPSEQSLKIYSAFRTMGATAKIKINAINGVDHIGAEIPTLTNSVIWFRRY